MKRLILFSLMTTLLATACGDRGNLELKARKTNEQKKPTDTLPTTPSENEKVEGSFDSPENADNRKLLVNGKATRNIKIGEEPLQTRVFCLDNITKNLTGKEPIKIQGGGQIMARQEIRIPVPERGENPLRSPKNPKALINIVCMGVSADLKTEPPNVKIEKLMTGDILEDVLGKFSNLNENDETFKATIACVTKKEMGLGDKILLPEGDAKRVDLLIAEGTKILFETANDHKDTKNFILLVCDKAAQ